MFEYDCKYCDNVLNGSFGDAVYCEKCNITFETDCELVDAYEGNWASWLTDIEHKGEIDETLS